MVGRSKRAGPTRPERELRLYVVHQHPIVSGRARAHFGKRAAIEHVRDGVARFDHDEADRAGFEIAAIIAGPKSRDRSAGNRGQRTIEGAYDRSDRDLMGRAGESISAALPLLGVDETRVAQFAQDVIQELF